MTSNCTSPGSGPGPYICWWGETLDLPSEAVVAAVASLTDRDQTAMPALSETVDPDRLNAMLTGDHDTETTVTITYAGCTVVVASNGRTVAAETSAPDLTAQLQSVLQEAVRSGTDVLGSHSIQTPADYPEWEVLVTEVVRPDE